MTKKEGYIALTSILIINAVVILVAAGISLLSISESDMGLGKKQSSEAYYFANSCAEEGLQKIRESENFGGRETLNYAKGKCEYNIVKQGNQRTVEATGIVSNFTRKIKVEIDEISPSINIISWEEVDDF